MSAFVTLSDYIENSAAKSPDRPAVVDPDGTVLSYRALDERANRVAHWLVTQGVAAGDRVGICLPKGVVSVSTIFGILKAGGVYVPVDYTAPVERNRYIFSNCQVKAAVVDHRCTAIFDEPGEGGHLPAAILVHGGDALFDRAATAPVRAATVRERSAPKTEGPVQSSTYPSLTVGALKNTVAALKNTVGALNDLPATRPPVPRRGPDDLAYILYTSGSTGLPKGVMLSQENGTSYVNWCSDVFHPTPDDRFTSHAPFHFDLSILDIYVPIKHGATLYIISEELGKNAAALGPFIQDNRITCWYSVPSILSLMTQYGKLEQVDCSSLRIVNFAGEVFPVKYLRRLRELWPHVALYNIYGPTETNVCTFYRVPDTIPPEREEPYPIGKVCSHCESLVIGDDGRPVAPGEEGLLYIAGKPVLQGYWADEERTNRAFATFDGKRYYNTGDVVRLDDNGDFVFLGRKDRMVKRHGYRIELGEIEAALYKHTGVAEAAAIAVAEAGGPVTIRAVIAPKGGVKLGVIVMKQHCSANLPGYMIPDTFTFMDALPLTSTGKVDYQSLTRNVAES